MRAVSLTPFHEIDGRAGEKTHAGARLAQIAPPLPAGIVRRQLRNVLSGANRREHLRISQMFSR